MRYVVAIGGNALRNLDRMDKLRKELEAIAELYDAGHQIVVTHGNGPQVGELASIEKEGLATLTAQTQAEIGIKLQIGIMLAMADAKVSRKLAKDTVVVVLSSTVVDGKSAEFSRPTKPIGDFYSKKGMAKLKSKGFEFRKLVGGYRRVVASPMPEEIIEVDVIKRLLKAGHIVITCGGGGIPVAYKGKRLAFVEAVVDKDRASSLLASEIQADGLFILTNVDGAYLDYKKKGQRLLGRISVQKMEQYLAEGHFEEGSMKPKVEACIDFVKARRKIAVIGNLDHAGNALSLRKATVITP